MSLIKDNVAYHQTLSPAAWEDDVIRPEVRTKLLEIALIFTEYLDIPNFKVVDVVLTGSMANYNYTKFSDFDVHVVTRYSDLECDDIAEAFYHAKKQIWNDNHDIMVNGHEAELYVEDLHDPPTSAGMFSLLRNKWIKMPTFDPPEINDIAIEAKVKDFAHQIDSAINNANSSQDIQRLRTKIRQMRRAGLDAEGEYGVENLTFKILRNMGYLDKLSKAYYQQQDQELSL